MRLSAIAPLACTLILASCQPDGLGTAQQEVGVIKSQLRGYDLGPPFPAGFRDSGLVNGYAEGEWIPFIAVLGERSLEVADELAGSVGDGQYLAAIILPTFSERHGANGISEMETSGTFGEGNLLPIPNPFDDQWLRDNGYSPFVLGAYSDTGDIDAAPLMGDATQRTGPTRFGGNVSSVSVPVTFTLDPNTTHVELQFSVRLAPANLLPITPEGQAFPGTTAGDALGAADFFPGPGPLFVGYDVGKPTGIATVPIRVDRHSCESNDECPPGELCGGERGCLDPCVDDSTCSGDDICEDGLCEPPPAPCTEAEDCDGNLNCIGGYCLPECPESCADPEFCDVDPCDPGDDGTPPCVTDDQCSDAYICEDGVCQPPEPPCDVSCPEGDVCHGGFCEPPGEPCTEDVDCDGGEACLGGFCEPPLDPPCAGDDCAPCQFTEDCDGGFICLGDHCVPVDPPRACDQDSPCADGQVCQGGFCEPPPGQCQFDEECGGDDVCAAGGVCEPPHPPIPCDDVSDCPSGDSCTQGFCTPPADSCDEQGGCGDGYTCIVNLDQCVPEHPPVACTNTNQCPGGDICINDVCQPEPPGGTCQNDHQCDGDDVCNDGYCLPPPDNCQNDSQCPSDFECISGYCIPPHDPIACDALSDCPSGDECQGGYCVAPPEPCEYDEQCGGDDVCGFGSCTPEHPPVACALDTECPTDDYCVSGFCEPTTPCVSDGECPGGELCQEGNCYPGQPPEECTVVSDCPPGNDDVYLPTCYGGFCEPSGGSCTVDVDCPGGFVCVGGECLEGADPTACDTSFDCPGGSFCREGYCRDGGTPNTCETGNDCPNLSNDDVGEACINGVCSGSLGAARSCDSDAICPSGTLCTSGVCQAVAGACDLNSDCGDGESCLKGWCARSCSSASECSTGESCSLGRCSASCDTYSQCSAYEGCFQGGCVPQLVTVSAPGGNQSLWDVAMPGAGGDVEGGCSTSGGSGMSGLLLLIGALFLVGRRSKEEQSRQ